MGPYGIENSHLSEKDNRKLIFYLKLITKGKQIYTFDV